MTKALLLAPLAAAALLAGCTGDYAYGGRPHYAGGYGVDGPAGDWGYYDRGAYDRYGRYDWNRPDPRYRGYYADRYYRADPRYRERVLTRDDRIYRGRDNRYYCRRSDGTTGLIVGGVAGATLGSIIAEGDSRPLGAILGGIGGAAAGAAIDSSSVRCR